MRTPGLLVFAGACLFMGSTAASAPPAGVRPVKALHVTGSSRVLHRIVLQRARPLAPGNGPAVKGIAPAKAPRAEPVKPGGVRGLKGRPAIIVAPNRRN